MGQNGKFMALPVAAAIAFAIAACLILLQPTKWHQYQNFYATGARSDWQLIRDGKEIKEHTEFVEMIKRGLGINRPISILKGPYMFVGVGRWLESPLRYYILVDDGFWEEFSDTEQKALLAHELGHFIYSPLRTRSNEASLNKSLEMQIGADSIAARYTSPEAMISVLNKFKYRLMPMGKDSEMTYDKRTESLEKLKQGK